MRVRSTRRTRRATPIREALAERSSLRERVLDGIEAIESTHRFCLAEDVRGSFADSLDLDSALRSEHPQASRWDYLVGHRASAEIIGLEVHTAEQGEIGAVIRKKEEASRQLSSHLRPGRRISNWLWVACGRICFADTDRARRRLDQHGIQFVGKQVRGRHLPASKNRA